MYFPIQPTSLAIAVLLGVSLLFSNTTFASDSTAQDATDPIENNTNTDTNTDTDTETETEADVKPDENENLPPEDIAELPAVEVHSDRPCGSDETQDTTSVSGEKLRESTRPSTLEAISQEAGDIYVSSRGGGVHGVASGASGGMTIRGLGGSPNTQVLIVEDGVPDCQGIFGHPIPDAYVPFLLDRVYVIKGGDSVLYGTNALGGVVVFESRRRKEEGFSLENDVAYGSYNTVRETVSMLGKWGRWNTSASFHVLRTDGHRDGADGMNMVGQINVSVRALSGLRLGLRNKVMHLTGGDPGTASHPYTDHWYDVLRNNSSLSLRYRYKRVKLSVIPYFHLGIHKLYDGFYSLDYTAGGKAEVDWTIIDSLRLVGGFATDTADGEVENRIDGDKPAVQGMTNYALYLQLSYKPVKVLNLVAGGRVVYNTAYGFVLLYKGGFSWDIYEHLRLRSRVTRNFRQPTIRERYLPYPTANPDLKPEFSLNWDVGLVLTYPHIKVSVTGYRSGAKNLIKYFGSWPSAEVVNIDSLVVWGVEGRIALTELGPVYMSVSGGWQDVGRYTKQNPDAKLDFTVGAGHEFGRHFIGGSISGEWVRGLYQNNYHRDHQPDVFFIDASIRYRYQVTQGGWSLEPYVLLRNLLDCRYEYIKDYPMPGFNVLGGLKVTI